MISFLKRLVNVKEKQCVRSHCLPVENAFVQNYFELVVAVKVLNHSVCSQYVNNNVVSQ